MKKSVKWINVVLFTIVGLIHLWRIVTNRTLILGSFHVPVWTSYLVVLFLAVLVYLNVKSE